MNPQDPVTSVAQAAAAAAESLGRSIDELRADTDRRFGEFRDWGDVETLKIHARLDGIEAQVGDLRRDLAALLVAAGIQTP